MIRKTELTKDSYNRGTLAYSKSPPICIMRRFNAALGLFDSYFYLLRAEGNDIDTGG